MTGASARGTALVLDQGSPLLGAVVSALSGHYLRIVVTGDGAGAGLACDPLDADLGAVTGQARLADFVRQTPDLVLAVNLLNGLAPENGLDRQLALLRRWCDASVVLHAALVAITTAQHRTRLLNLLCETGDVPVMDPVLIGARGFVHSWTAQCRAVAHPGAPAVGWLEVGPSTVRQALLEAAGVA